MASEPGGRADKLGNEFERLWMVRHLIELVAGRASSVKIEALGDDERGTEFWVVRPDGTREAHQCKRENGSVGKWSVADLESKRVISNARSQLDRDVTHRFVFASGDKAPFLSDLAERSHRCDDPAEFVSYLATTSRDLDREFQALCRHLDAAPEQPGDSARVLDFLRRFSPRVVDKYGLRDEVEELAARWFSGEPSEVVAALKDLTDDSIGRTLHEAEVLARLPTGSRLRDLAREPSLHSSIEELRGRFERSYRDLLIAGRPLGRRETTDLLDRLTAFDGPRVVLLHGAGGDGKSGVVFELVARLASLGIHCVPMRLDRDRPDGSPLAFGRSLGLPGSPASSLAAAAESGLGVLVLDQVDALRWTAAHSSYAWDVCERTIAEALRHPHLRVVVTCRTFDAEDDPQIRAWRRRAKAGDLRVGPLDDAAVDAVVADHGVVPSTLGDGPRRVLRSPQALYLWVLLRQANDDPPSFRTMTDLMRGYWIAIRRDLKKLRQGRYEEVLDTLVKYMDRRGSLSAPRTVVDRWPDEVDALLSMNIVVEGPARLLLFAHQTSLDYLTADGVLRQILEGSGSVLDWLASDDQPLFRRGQMRQVLILLRDDDPERHLESLRDILISERFRFHLKHLALQLLGHVDVPSEGEADLVHDLLARPEWIDHVFRHVLLDRVPWFDVLHRRGTLRRWLEGRDEGFINIALYLIEPVVQIRVEAIESLLLERGRERWTGRLDRLLWRHPIDTLDATLFDAFVASTRQGATSAREHVDWKALAAASPMRCVRLLEARMDHDLDRAARVIDGVAQVVDLSAREDSSLLVGMDDLAAAAAAVPVEAWDRLLPHYQRLVRISGPARHGFDFNALGESEYEIGGRLKRERRVLDHVLSAAGGAMAKVMPEDFWERVAAAPPVANRSAGPKDEDIGPVSAGMIGAEAIERLIKRGIPQGPDDRADDAIDWLLGDPGRIRREGGEAGEGYDPARQILLRYAGLCSEDLFGKLLKIILAHRPANEKRSYRLYHDRERRETIWGDIRFDALECNKLGSGQYLLLSALPRERMTSEALSWLGVLECKFGPVGPLLKPQARSISGAVGSTIPRDRLPKLSDRTWLKIIGGDWMSRPKVTRQMGPERLGELGVEHFASDFRHMARLQPERFVHLALQIPVDSDPRYPVAILQALGFRSPEAATSGEPVPEQVDVTLIEAMIRRFSALEGDRDFAWAVCGLVASHHDAGWDDSTTALIARLAIGHPDPGPEQLDTERFSRLDLNHAAINCVRGEAARSIGDLLFDRPGRLAALRPALESLLGDPHPAVRSAAVGLALPIWNIDREFALDVLLGACSHPNDDVLLTYQLKQFFEYALLGYFARLTPLITRMVSSNSAKVAEAGAIWATIAWAYRGHLEGVASACVAGDRCRRMGVAKALADAIASGHDRDSVLDWARGLFDDPEKDVRDTAARIVRDSGLLDRDWAVDMVGAFVQSRALDDNVDDLLRGLEGFTGPLRSYAPALCAVADRFAGPLAAEARDLRTARPHDAGVLAKLLLRLYEQSEQDRTTRRLCLDAWDRLLRQGLGHDILRDIDGQPA